MITNDSDGPVIPVLIKNQEGCLLATALQNTKASQKSLEQDTLWVVDGVSGRVLPWPAGGTLLEIQAGPYHNTAVVHSADLSALKPASTIAESQKPVASAAELESIGILLGLEALIQARKESLPEGSYTTHLFKSGLAKIKKKTGEEAIELILADSPDTIRSEAADLLYHMTVLFVESKITWTDVLATLATR
jgi:phosphoribosyl-ATP pyrophosphohydrolase